MASSKKKLLDIVARLSFPEYGNDSDLYQINISQTLRGERTIDVDPENLNTLEKTAWLFGFVSSHCHDEKLIREFLRGLKSNWYYHDFTNEDFAGLISELCMDVMLQNKELFKKISEHIFSKRIKNEYYKHTFSLAYGTGLIDIGWDEIMELKKLYGLC